MSDHLEDTEAHVDARIATLERRMEEQRDKMYRELDALIKMNQALRKENKGLRAGTTTSVTLFRNVVPIGLTDAALPSPDALAETEVVVAKQTDKRKRAECLKRPIVREQLFSSNLAL